MVRSDLNVKSFHLLDIVEGHALSIIIKLLDHAFHSTLLFKTIVYLSALLHDIPTMRTKVSSLNLKLDSPVRLLNHSVLEPRSSNRLSKEDLGLKLNNLSTFCRCEQVVI